MGADPEKLSYIAEVMNSTPWPLKALVVTCATYALVHHAVDVYHWGLVVGPIAWGAIGGLRSRPSQERTKQ